MALTLLSCWGPPTKRLTAGILLTALVAAVMSGCGVLGSVYRYRYKMTVEVQTVDGLATGSAVYEQTVGKSNVDLGDLSAKRGVRTRGEAVVVDLPGQRALVVLIPDSEVAQAALDPNWHNDWVENARRISSGRTPGGPLPLKPAPVSGSFANPADGAILVSFRDIDEPKSVELVNPDNLAASLGAGVRLLKITVQPTTDPVTTGIDKKLKWLRAYFDSSLTGQRFSNPYGPVVDNLRAGSFSTELGRT